MIFIFFSVLEARIQQLQSDVLDVQHAKVHFVKVPSGGRDVSSDRTPRRGSPQDKTDVPKSGVHKEASKPQFSRWMEKLSEEKENKLKKLHKVQQIFQKSAKGKQRLRRKPSDKVKAAASSSATVSSENAASSHSASKSNRKALDSKSARKDGGETMSIEELAEMEELDKKLCQEQSHWTISETTESLQDGENGGPCGDIQLSILSYLEACVFMGDIERAQKFLLSQHRVMTRRKHLTTDMYNIMIKVWAKKVRSKMKT